MATKQKRKRGRPPKRRIFSAEELRATSREYIQKSSERRLGIKELDVEEFCDDVMKVTGKHKFTRAEMDEMREKVDFLYRKYLDEKWEQEAQHLEPYKEALKAIHLAAADEDTKFMTPEEWHLAHGLRADGSRKRGPAPKKKKTVWDLSPGEKGTAEKPGEPIDITSMEQEIEQRMMEEAIAQQKHEDKFPKGKRMRRGIAPVQRRPKSQDFWI